MLHQKNKYVYNIKTKTKKKTVNTLPQSIRNLTLGLLSGLTLGLLRVFVEHLCPVGIYFGSSRGLLL